MDTPSIVGHRRPGRRRQKPPTADDTVGSRLWAAIWYGPESKAKGAMVARFGKGNCSNWARRSRKPEGDVRSEIEKLTGISYHAWAMQAAVEA